MLLTLEILALACVHVLALAAACHALLTKRDPRAALGWCAVLVFLPVIGLGVYLIFGIGRAHSRAERIMKRLAHIASHYQHLPADLVPEARLATPEAQALARLGGTLTSLRLSQGNQITPLCNGDVAYPAMLEAIYAAESHVFLSSYIFNYGHAGQAFITALKTAHERNVDVRVLVDGIGSLYSWRKPWRILAGYGVPALLFRPVKLFPPNLGINLRSHRKVLVCDGTAFTGGMNIADGDIMDIPRFDAAVREIEKKYNVRQDARVKFPQPKKQRKTIQDMQFRCSGPVTRQLRKAFLLNWSFCSETIAMPFDLPAKSPGDSVARIIMDGPGNDADALNDLICGAINMARSHVRIMTPYFLPTHDLMAALRSAAQRGIDVRIILPLQNNLPYMTWATQRLLPDLLVAGARVWYQKPPFAHTKLLCVDKFYSLVGSANLDARSLRLNFELNMEVYNPELAGQLEAFMDGQISNGLEVKKDALKNLSLCKKLRNAACWVFSPYL